jgi:hypothetical protein
MNHEFMTGMRYHKRGAFASRRQSTVVVQVINHLSIHADAGKTLYQVSLIEVAFFEQLLFRS